MKSQLPVFTILFLLFACNVNSLFSQSSPRPVIAMRVETSSVANDSINGLYDLSDTTIFTSSMIIFLEDTVSIDAFEVQLGDGDNPISKLEHTFAWDSSPGNGLSYTRSVYKVTIGLGEFMGMINFEATLRVKRTDNSYSELVHFSR